MGLADVVQKAAVSAFKAIGNIPITCTYTSKGTSVYDPSDGSYTSTDTDYEDLKFLFEDYTSEEIMRAGGAILRTDQKASIPNLNLTPTPKIKDTITDSDSAVWTVEDFKKDAARALWTFQVRESE